MESRAPEGVLLVDKPVNVTSHDVVAVVRRVMRVRRVGHAGTLDPFATGLLVLLIGRGTRLAPYIDGEPKVYDATIRFGSETETDDETGATTRTAPLPIASDIRRAIQEFLTGEIDQVPPDYSAKKVGGIRAYAAARRGQTLSLAPARVTVREWEIRAERADEIDVRITCSGGTYVRALARDLGRRIGSAAHLTALRRTQSGVFHVRDAVTLDRIREGGIQPYPLRDAVSSLPAQQLDGPSLGRVMHGNPVPARVDGYRVALLDGHQVLVGIAERSGAELQPRLVLRDE
jgi:tRNA pseudouridine55 synthase